MSDACAPVFSWKRGIAWLTAAGVLSLGTPGCTDSEQETPRDSIVIGILLPYTGNAAEGYNLERAMLWAVERINSVGGIAGRSIQVVAQDTHSDVDRGLESARRLLDESHVTSLFGPDEEDLAAGVLPLARERQVINISGGVTSPTIGSEDDGYWFRMIPSATALGTALATRMINDGVSRIIVIYVDDEYGRGFSSVVEQRFRANGGTVVSSVGFSPKAMSFGNLFDRLQATSADAAVLAAYPRAGATIIHEASAIGWCNRWYASNSLKSAVFTENLLPGSYGSLVGVAAAVATDSEIFAADFNARWEQQPLLGAFFYYDAVAVWALGEALAAQRAGGVPAAADVRSTIIEASSNGAGRLVGWYELEHGIELIRQGVQTKYRGASGYVNFDDEGEVMDGVVQFWQVAGRGIVNTDTVIVRRE